ncbi:UNKNOWN [Stylonychia lemnae]|uniref:Uncharacterized protein n=1 Tax=Stylonychia lemnae TaxID=5949 RepID=A0A077ZSC8_STYLE|nr:UNKNOWN [Stylonychia lemnae]|eukprot:CDW72793.1 UNKNOWN [Stylonychia lemnae]
MNQSGIKMLDNESMIYFESNNIKVQNRRNFNFKDQSIDKNKIEQLQSMALLYGKNRTSEYEIEGSANHQRRQSKSSASLNQDDGQRMIKQWHNFKKTSMVQGERDSLDGCLSEHSQLDIPNEHMTKENQKTQSTNQSHLNSGDKQPKTSSEKKGTQRNRQGPQSQNPAARQTQAVPFSRVKIFNINTVRDSSPLKTIGLFNNNLRDSQACKGGSQSQRQQIEDQNHINQIKMFGQKTQFINTFKSPQQADGTYKQPKQGQKKAQQYIPSQRHHQVSQYQTQNSPQIILRDSLLKNAANSSNMYLTQANGSMMNKAQDQIESDFVNSQEEDDLLRTASHYQTGSQFATHQESTFTTGQSFHLPQTQALGQSKKTNNIQGISSKINNLNVRAGNNAPTVEQQPLTGYINDKVSPNHKRRGLHFIESQNQLNQSTNNQRVASNFRNESLERILGDKANLLFDQIDKIQQKEYVKLNRSLLYYSNERTDSSNRNVQHTPMLIQGSTQDLEQKDGKNANVYRKRQLTFTDGNQSQHLRQIQQQLMQTLPKQMSNANQNRNAMKHHDISQHQTALTQLTEPDEANVINTDRKGKEMPNSPGTFPSSVKEKIKNITQRIKQEVQKQEETQLVTNSQNLKRKSHQHSNISGQQLNDNTQTSIKSQHYVGNFKKYLNADQADKNNSKIEAKNLKQSNLKKPRNSNIENKFDNKKGKLENKSIIHETNDTHHRQPFKKQDLSTYNNLNNKNLSPPRQVDVPKQSSMFQRRKLSQNGKNQNKLIKSQNQTNSINLKDSIHAKESIIKKPKQEIECIIYVPNHPPEIFSSKDLQSTNQTKDEQHQQVQQIQTQSTFITPEVITSRKENNNILPTSSATKSNDDTFKDRTICQSEEKIDENFIKSKYNNLLKETRQKIRDNEKTISINHNLHININNIHSQIGHNNQVLLNQSYHTPRGIATINNQQFLNVNSNGKNSPKQIQMSEDQKASSKYASMRKSHILNRLQSLSNSQTPKNELKVNSNVVQQNIQVQEVAAKLNFEKQAHNYSNDVNLYKQSMLIQQQDIFAKMRASLDQQNMVQMNIQNPPSMYENQALFQQLQLQQQQLLQQHQQQQQQQNQHFKQPLSNRYMSQIDDLHQTSIQYQPFSSQIQTPQYNPGNINSQQQQQQQNMMFQYRQQIPSYIANDCQAHCKCHQQMSQQFSCQNQVQQLNIPSQMMQQQPYMSQTLSPQINQNPFVNANLQQQVQQPDFFNNYLAQQQYHHFIPQYMQQYQFSPLVQNQIYSHTNLQQTQLPYPGQNMIHQAQPLFASNQAGFNSYDNSQMKVAFDQGNNKPAAMTQENLMRFNQQSIDLQKQSLGLQLVNALNEFDKLDEFDN